MKQRVIYYSSLEEEHSGIDISPIKIEDDYKYINNNILWKIAAFIVYRLIVYPFAYLYCKIKFHTKVVNKKVLKEYKKGCYFLFGNHTQAPGDGFFPNLISYPKRNYVVVCSENVSIKGTKNIMMMLGALPLPDTISASRNFLRALETRCKQNAVITIYPEAHIWPYYTDIRPFKPNSLRYPIRFGVPSFCYTTTYVKRRFSKKPKVILYVDGPFYGEGEDLKQKEADLSNKVYNKMKERCTLSNYEYVKYIKK